MNYLLVDDDGSFIAILERVLKRRGNRVVCASDGAEAASQCSISSFDRVILDLKLEQESGLSILQNLKQLQPEMDILILTGYSSISTAVEAIKLGAINYLCKPASADEIVAAFDNIEANAEVPMQDSPPSVNRLEWEHIQRVLNENQGNISATARSLGMHRRTLQRKLQKRPVKT